MSKGFKIILFITIPLIVIFGGIYIFIGNDIPNKTKSKSNIVENNEPKKITKSVIPKGIQMDAEQITITENTLDFNCNIINNAKKTIDLKSVTVIIRDEKDEDITQFDITLNTALKSNEGMNISTQALVNTSSEKQTIIYIFN